MKRRDVVGEEGMVLVEAVEHGRKEPQEEWERMLKEDPWTGEVMTFRVPKAEAATVCIPQPPCKPSYWREREQQKR